MNDDQEKKMISGDRAVLLRHKATKAGLRNRRVWLTKNEELLFNELIAPLGSHVLGIASALDHSGLRLLERRVARQNGRPTVRKPGDDATPPSGPAAEPKPSDASQVMKAEPAAPPSAAAAPKPVDASQPSKPKTEDTDNGLPMYPDYQP